MSDPYTVLGITTDASDEEIKKAYRTLSRKYHPDANINNPLKDEAEAKFKEVQQAYKQIMDERQNGYSSYSSGAQYGFYGNSGQQFHQTSEEDIHLQAAMNYIRSGHYTEALHVLDGIRVHNARWYYYSAAANSGAGNNVTAAEHAQEAVRLEPDNIEYQMFLQRLNGTGGWYMQRQSDYGSSPFSGGNFCCKILALNLACNLCCTNGMCCFGPGIFI